MNHLKVDGYTHLYRDPKTNSIINKNMTEYKEYLSRRQMKTEESQKIQDLEGDVASIKEDLGEIKSLLRSLINGS
jgi:hypothetical protein